jgi:hypothetical protein
MFLAFLKKVASFLASLRVPEKPTSFFSYSAACIFFRLQVAGRPSVLELLWMILRATNAVRKKPWEN